MSLQMAYKGFRWNVNPSEITITCSRNLKEQPLPLKGSLLQEMGRKKRQISGKGCFLGRDSLLQFRELQRLFEEGGAGLLVMPGLPPLRAVFSSLQLQALGAPGGRPIIPFPLWRRMSRRRKKESGVCRQGA